MNRLSRKTAGQDGSDHEILELIELLKRRHMCRDFDTAPVEREKLETLVKAGNRLLKVAICQSGSS